VAENQVTFRITQVRSTISHPAPQREMLRSLGLRRIGMSVERPDNAAVRGAIRAVNHLVAVEVLGGEKPKATKKKAAATDADKAVEVTPPAVEETDKKTAKETTKKVAKKTTAAEKTAKKNTKKTAKKTAKKTTKKTTKKAAKKTAKKTTKKTTKKAAKKASKASGGSS